MIKHAPFGVIIFDEYRALDFCMKIFYNQYGVMSRKGVS